MHPVHEIATWFVVPLSTFSFFLFSQSSGVILKTAISAIFDMFFSKSVGSVRQRIT
jgi:hypothetical protein